ncbi:Transforming growth factor-beta-induced protein ig-h3 [Armadillidium nasatum]|uniref:Transforming growth factor-beta-induced protein ig-h3 n=1 Tax=Armadillidium nasatum TaxID=96803 RepID=A0A5N5SIN1_9CRUS|nr:Transforming growth factor-beta-induced protein ig-h3 [Armadillidium nasatum]
MFIFACVVFALGVELTRVKKQKDEFIIFTPTNQAFEKMGKPELTRLKSDPESLERILLSHISPQEKHPDGIFDGISLKTLNPDEKLNISFTGNGAFNDNHNHMIKEESSGSDTLIKVLNDNGCKNFALLITESNLPDLKISGPYTIFCPNDEAFASLSSDELRVMKSNDILVNNLIKSHIIEGRFLSDTLEDGMVIESLSSGYFFKFMIKDDGSITVNNVPITVRDLKASNGVVHVINNILISSSKRIRSENLPAVLKTTEDSFTNVEHMVALVVEVTGPMIEDLSKNNTSFYVAVNENTDLLPSTVDETSAQEILLNGEDHNSTPNKDFATTMNTLEGNRSELDLTDGTENESDSSGHLDSEVPNELPKNREEASNNTSEEGAKINVENVTEENLNNENENNSSTENLKRRLDEDSRLNETTIESQDEDSATTVAAETESSSPSESSMDEAEITNSTLTINEK